MERIISVILTVITVSVFLMGCKNPSDNPVSSAESNNSSMESSVFDFDYATGRVKKKVKIVGDSSDLLYSFSGLQPYFDSAGMTMLPMVHFEELFKGDVSYKIAGNEITITKTVLGIINVVVVTIDSNIMTVDGEKIEMKTTPVKKDGTIYIPLEYLGTALKYGVGWNTGVDEVTFYQYASVYVYVWNEDENSAESDLRYSYSISGDQLVNAALMTANPTRNFGDIKEILKKLPAGEKVVLTRLYRLTGCRVSHIKLNEMTDEIQNMGLKRGYADYCLDDVPPIIKDLSVFGNNWFSKELFAMEEEVLYNSKEQVYRFSYFPSFTDNIVVRLEIHDNNTADLHYKLSEGISHGKGISKHEKAKLDKNETQEFLELLNKIKYWSLPTEIERLGVDGHHTILEGVKGGKHHIVDRWSPEESDPFYSVEEYFLNIVKQKFEK